MNEESGDLMFRDDCQTVSPISQMSTSSEYGNKCEHVSEKGPQPCIVIKMFRMYQAAK